ncbi:Recombination protein MgsA [Coriobacterium glomerans PW2]|uniref:Recombination protein MgsA n=1 Tax=Coriobacterium glomerans (strain ATCC 49209 / DSM 20642 / JCM 10262 / PW2) TaxID=700015 RepID=F2N806_CORGP|nr:replication-associated recombination protein A [Coriobacterium glomerans]AEB07115.1 Recombination protein MgsA [Coriobacterium glomerans PW2]
MDTLFTAVESDETRRDAPLAVRMRPSSLADFVGQSEAVGPGSWLRQAIELDRLSSVILFGPAGVGKTTLARIIAMNTRSEFIEVSAVSGTVKDLRRAIEDAKRRLLSLDRRTILFIDEIHRFSKSQQDTLLHAVEDRVVVMVGATTENPFFEVNSALLSRSRIVELKPLQDEEIGALIRRALGSPRGLAGRFAADEQTVDAIALMAAGDARAALTTLELASEIALTHSEGQGQDGDTNAGVIEIGRDDVDMVNPRPGLSYDKDGDAHYDVISAFIKSMRGSDPDAAIYWLARMIDAGEDPKFIARRIMIAASEDVGNADPQALLVAHAAFKAAEAIGYPECRINLAQAALYIALAPKSNTALASIDAALADIRSGGRRPCPSHLRDRHRPGSQNYGCYLYPHSYPEGYVDQRYLPEGLERGTFFRSAGRGWEEWRVELSGGRSSHASANSDTPEENDVIETS